jgi:hypothetical protein
VKSLQVDSKGRKKISIEIELSNSKPLPHDLRRMFSIVVTMIQEKSLTEIEIKCNGLGKCSAAIRGISCTE